MTSDNPYESPASHGEPDRTRVVLESSVTRLTAKQYRWLRHSQFGLSALYVGVGLMALFYVGQIVFVFTMLGPDSSNPISDGDRLRITVFNSIFGALAIWLTLATYRLNRAIGHVREHDAAPAAINRAIRLGSRASIALGCCAAAQLALTFVVPPIWGLLMYR